MKITDKKIIQFKDDKKRVATRKCLGQSVPVCRKSVQEDDNHISVILVN